MSQSKKCSKNNVLDVLIDYGKKIYGDDELEGIEKLENPIEKADKLWSVLEPKGEKLFVSKDQDIEEVVKKLREKLSDNAARIYMEKLINKQILKKMEENEVEYMNQLKLQIINKHVSNETSSTLEKYAQMEKKKGIALSKQIGEVLRPHNAGEIIGQAEGVKALISKVATPYPQHVIIYGPPGVGKTSAARIALKEAKSKEYSPFMQEAPFIEANGATIRWDPREAVNPLLGSVHDPIYQGAKKDLSDMAIPEPKPGLVTEAHGGILFIDEIGELDIMLQNKLLKVLEDKCVKFESSYYDKNSKEVPKYIKMLFEEGAPADFILIGATTRSPEEINPALRSRCAEVFFNSLSPKNIVDILDIWSNKLNVIIEKDAKELISRYVYDGRKAVSVLLDCYGKCLYENKNKKVIIDYEKAYDSLRVPIKSSLSFSHLGKEVGKIYGAGINGLMGSIIEFEGVSFKRNDSKGNIRFNETAGQMTKDSLFNALTVLRKNYNIDVDKYDIHVNCIGGGKVDGPSAGAAITCLLYSSIEDLPFRKDTCITGEISITGAIKTVGGVREKTIAAVREGFSYMIIPKGNERDVLNIDGINIIVAEDIEEIINFLVSNKSEVRGVV